MINYLTQIIIGVFRLLWDIVVFKLAAYLLNIIFLKLKSRKIISVGCLRTDWQLVGT